MKRLQWYEFFTLNAYSLGLSMAASSLTPVVIPALVVLFVPDEMKNTFNSALRVVGLTIAILVQAAMGAVSDRTRTRWGRRRPYIVGGTLVDLLFLAMIAMAGNFWMLLLAVALLQISSNVAQAAQQGLIPDLVPEDQRGRASGLKAMMELLPLILVRFTVGPSVDEGRVWTAIMFIMGFLVLTMLLTVLFTRERTDAEPPCSDLGAALVRAILLTVIFLGVTGVLGGLVSFTARLLREPGTVQIIGVGLAGLVAIAGSIMIGVWGSARAGLGAGQSSFTWWIVNRLMFLASIGSIQAFAQYFLKDVIRVEKPASATASLMIVVGVFTLLAALGSGFLADRIERKKLLSLAGLIAAAGTLLLILSPDMTVVYISGSILGLSAGLFMTTSWALGTDLAPKTEAARYMGISNLAGAGAGIVGAGIGGPLADFFNSYSQGAGYLVVFGIYAACFLLSIVTLIAVKPARKGVV